MKLDCDWLWINYLYDKKTITIQWNVFLCLPVFILPCGFQEKNFLVILLAGFSNVCPIQHVPLLLTSWFTGILVFVFGYHK